LEAPIGDKQKTNEEEEIVRQEIQFEEEVFKGKEVPKKRGIPG